MQREGCWEQQINWSIQSFSFFKNLIVNLLPRKRKQDCCYSGHENCRKHKLSVTLLQTIKRQTNKLAILISSNQSQDGMLNITKNTCSCNCPQKLDLNSLKIHNATRFHLYSWLLIFRWTAILISRLVLLVGWTNDLTPPRLFKSRGFIFKLYISHGVISQWGMRWKTEERATILESIFGNRVWSDEFCWMCRDVAPATA